jgi:phage gp36-like protein
MTYITQTEFEKRFGEVELADLTETNDFNAAEADAASLIDGYLASRYSLPLASVPAMVKGWAGDILRFKLWDDHAPEEVRRRYDDALAQLKMLAQGLIALPPGADGQAQATGLAFGGFSADRVFTSETLSGF